MKRPVIVFTIADKQNFSYAISMLKSFRKFHDWPVILYTNETDPRRLRLLPLKIECRDLTPYLADGQFFYRATPVLAEPLMDEYELVLKMDADQLVLGDMSYILNTKDYDVGTVLNANRFDPKYSGWVEIARVGIQPIDYFNCGLVAMRNKRFVHNWLIWCYSVQFDRCQYKEQDGLNLLCYDGNWNVRCFDHGDGVAKMHAWWGLISKGEGWRAIIVDKKIIIPKGLGDTPYPPEAMEIKVIHMAGGKDAKKDNWAAFWPPTVIERINELTK